MPANDNLDLILRRHQEIAARLAEGVAGAQYSALSRELNELEPVVGQESHMIVRSSAAGALVHVPRGNGELAAGSTVRWLRL